MAEEVTQLRDTKLLVLGMDKDVSRGFKGIIPMQEGNGLVLKDVHIRKVNFSSVPGLYLVNRNDYQISRDEEEFIIMTYVGSDIMMQPVNENKFTLEELQVKEKETHSRNLDDYENNQAYKEALRRGIYMVPEGFLDDVEKLVLVNKATLLDITTEHLTEFYEIARLSPLCEVGNSSFIIGNAMVTKRGKLYENKEKKIKTQPYDILFWNDIVCQQMTYWVPFDRNNNKKFTISKVVKEVPGDIPSSARFYGKESGRIAFPCFIQYSVSGSERNPDAVNVVINDLIIVKGEHFHTKADIKSTELIKTKHTTLKGIARTVENIKANCPWQSMYFLFNSSQAAISMQSNKMGPPVLGVYEKKPYANSKEVINEAGFVEKNSLTFKEGDKEITIKNANPISQGNSPLVKYFRGDLYFVQPWSPFWFSDLANEIDVEENEPDKIDKIAEELSNIQV